MMRIIFFSSAAAAQSPRSGATGNFLAAIRARWHILARLPRQVIGLVTGLLALTAGALVLASLA